MAGRQAGAVVRLQGVRKPAADSCFWYLALPHAGHLVSGASETFCRCSSWCPQAAQRYS